MKSSRATRLGRAALLLPMLLATACAAVPDLGAKSAPATAGNYASAQSLKAVQSLWPVEVGGRPITLAQLQSRAVTLDVQLVRSLRGGFHATSPLFHEE